MFPEAGGSSSFARHAFNEFWSFFAAWGQMLNYMLTIATSAFFVPHYIGGLFWPALEHPPGDVIAGIVAIFVLAAINIRGVEESIGVNLVLAMIDFCTQVLIVCVGLVLVFSPQTLIDNVHLGTAPTWANFFVAIPLCMLAYTGIETISNMSEEAKDPRPNRAQGDQPRGDRGVRDLRAAARDRALGAAGALRRQPLPDAARGR